MHTSDATEQSNITAYDPQIDGSADYYQRSLPVNLRNGIGHASQTRNTHQHQYQGQHQHQQQSQGHSQQQDYHQIEVQDGRERRAPAHRQHQAPANPSLRPQSCALESTVTTLLPYCTTGPPLQQDQVIALSDIVGSLRELVLLVRGAATGDAKCEEKLVGAVGTETASNIVGFFADEWEIE
jgi:hypothetical protein